MRLCWRGTLPGGGPALPGESPIWATIATSVLCATGCAPIRAATSHAAPRRGARLGITVSAAHAAGGAVRRIVPPESRASRRTHRKSGTIHLAADLLVRVAQALAKQEQDRDETDGDQCKDERILDERLPFIPLPCCGTPCSHGDSSAGGSRRVGAAVRQRTARSYARLKQPDRVGSGHRIPARSTTLRYHGEVDRNHSLLPAGAPPLAGARPRAAGQLGRAQLYRA